MRAEEAKNINTSLTSLGLVIRELSNPKPGFIPYRNSALTMLMKSSLSGNCLTHVIITVAHAGEMQGETVTSLRFGLQCGKIQAEVKKEKTQDLGSTVENLEN